MRNLESQNFLIINALGYHWHFHRTSLNVLISVMMYVDKRQTKLIYENNHILANFGSDFCFRYFLVHTKNMTRRSEYCLVIQWSDKTLKRYTVDFYFWGMKYFKMTKYQCQWCNTNLGWHSCFLACFAVTELSSASNGPEFIAVLGDIALA